MHPFAEGPLLFPHCSHSRGPPRGTEPGFELGPAVQQADAPLSELRRILLSYAAPFWATPHSDTVKFSFVWSGAESNRIGEFYCCAAQHRLSRPGAGCQEGTAAQAEGLYISNHCCGSVINWLPESVSIFVRFRILDIYQIPYPKLISNNFHCLKCVSWFTLNGIKKFLVWSGFER